MDRLIPELEVRGFLNADDVPAVHPGVRVFAGGLPHVRYLKISEGCDHGCAFCAIPLMRGKHRSFALDDIIQEAQLLEAQGAREINLVAQDLAHYGRDRRELGLGLTNVLEGLVRETTIPWIRMLYLYSAGLTPRLLELMATEPRILPYLDMPIQHASDAVLARMRRPERQRTIRQKVANIRSVVSDVAIRTTCIVGFPGETEQDFESLLEFLEEMQFDRVGAFTYSPQEGTRAAELEDDVPESVKRERLERLNEVQSLITAERHESRLGQTVPVLVDRVDEGRVQARTKFQADDIDGVTYVRDADNLTPGTFADVRLEEVVEDVDFVASLVRVASAPQQPPRRVRALRVLESVGSFGR
jgi:ribosomal protein S12 methylthiotransferase